jgi:hypothetical protein
MEYSKIKYCRPDIDIELYNLKELKQNISNSRDINEISSLFKKFNLKVINFITNQRIAELRNFQDTTNEFYRKEVSTLNTFFFQIDNLKRDLYIDLLERKNEVDLSPFLGEYFYEIAKNFSHLKK